VLVAEAANRPDEFAQSLTVAELGAAYWLGISLDMLNRQRIIVRTTLSGALLSSRFFLQNVSSKSQK
jgi:hypothetical protein